MQDSLSEVDKIQGDQGSSSLWDNTREETVALQGKTSENSGQESECI